MLMGFNFGSIFAQSYDDLWKKVESLLYDDKPKSVIEEAQKIYDKAKKEDCFPQMMKAQMCITEKRCDLDPELFECDEYEEMIATMEADGTIDPKQKASRLALMHCMLASAYNAMLDSYVHDFDQETREQFPAKAHQHALKALEDMATLSQVNCEQYVPLVNMASDGHLFNHDLLNVVFSFVVNDREYNLTEEEILDLYTKAIKVYRDNGNKNAIAMMKLRELHLRKSSNVKANFLSDTDYKAQLKTLFDEMQDEEAGIDVAIEYSRQNFSNKDEKLAFARWAIERWKDNERVNAFKNIEADIMGTSIRINASDNIIANRPFDVSLSYSNAENATLTLREYKGKNKDGDIYENGKILDTRKYDLPLDAENMQRKANNLPTSGTDKDVMTLAPGHYVMVVETEGAKSVQEVTVTSLRAVTYPLPDNTSTKIVVLDNETGRPVKNATVMGFETWEKEYKKTPTKKYTTDDKGAVVIKNYDKVRFYYMLAVRNESDYGTPREDCTGELYPRTSYDRYSKDEHYVLSAYTDRSIYRPGQTVHGAAMEYYQHADTVNMIKGSTVSVRISDPNYKTLYSNSIKLNDLGSLSFEFKLPEECKLGLYHLEVRNGKFGASTSFHVEEYKRPTYEVVFDEKQSEVKHELGDKFKIEGKAMMFSGAPNQGAMVNYTIEYAERHHIFFGFDMPIYGRNKMRGSYNWQELSRGETVTGEDGSFSIDVDTELPVVVHSENIIFRVKADVKDVAGEMESGEFTFDVKNSNYTKTEKEEEGPKDELKCSVDEISESQSAVITFKAKERDAMVHYCIISKNNIEEEGSKVLNGDELKFTVKYQKEWGDGVSVLVYYVRNGHLYYNTKTLYYVRPEKKLKLAWKTFRDNLTPGQNEQWVLTVKDHKDHIVSGAELLAVMYDASLDNIYPHDWDFSLYFERDVPSISLKGTNINSGIYLSLNKSLWFKGTRSRAFDYLRKFEHSRWFKPEKYSLRDLALGSAITYASPARSATKNVAYKKAVVESAPMVMEESAADVEEATEQEGANSLRTNLEELAFFYPHILTDEKGEAHIAFTLPDCLTEWKFIGIVHTNDVDYGKITAKATAKKDFMVQPNMPRFLRTGDKAEINAKIMNLCEKVVKGKATLRLINPETEEVLCTKTTDFNVEANQSTSVKFPFETTFDAGNYICEITATDGTASDGERNRLPILSTKVEVVENMPFYLTGEGTKNVDLTSLFNQNSNTVTDQQVQIGYTDNPALSVFESLKALQNPEHDNAPCYAAALYTNLVLLDMSKVLGDRIKDFNAEKTQATADKALEKLKKLQLGDGAWSWFEGMKGSYYITLSVAENLSRLQTYLNRHEDKCPKDVDNMLKKALKYLDKYEVKEYKWRKKNKMPLVPYNDDIRYLHIATDADKEMTDTYLTAMNKDMKNLTIYGRSEGVLIMKKYGREKEAKRFLESVKEYTVFKEGFGRYFATDLAYYSWMDYRIPTQLAAMRAVQNYSTEEFDPFLLDMQLWLLRQKQTQVWLNPINALDVADFLLTTNRKESLHEVTTPTLILDGKSVVQDSVYTDIKKVQNLTVTKTSPGISWGHVRTMFNEEVSNLQSYTSGELTIERKVIRNGNKVTIRHILHADRDMDFVTVKSQHAACLEPLRAVSGYQWMGGRGCYLEVHDSYINLFFDRFTRGTTTIDMDYYIARDGEYNSGYASIECSYAPEFGGHTKGEKMTTK